MNYETVFDLGAVGYRDGIWFAVGGLVLALALGGVVLQKRRGRRTALPWFLTVLGFVTAAGGGGVPLWDHHRLLGKLENGQALVAEGAIAGHTVEHVKKRDAKSGRYDSSIWETFWVGDVAFGFRRGRTPVGFLNGDDPPLDLHDGTRVRVHYVEDVPGDFSKRRIVRLEVASTDRAYETAP